jgi:hypothetical protein
LSLIADVVGCDRLTSWGGAQGGLAFPSDDRRARRQQRDFTAEQVELARAQQQGRTGYIPHRDNDGDSLSNRCGGARHQASSVSHKHTHTHREREKDRARGKEG